MLEEKITEVLDKLMELGGTLGTPAFDAVVRGVQLEGLFSLINGAVALVLCFSFACVMAKAIQVASDDNGNDNIAITTAPIVFVSGVLTVVTGVAGPVLLLNSANWIAAIDPVAEIARWIVGG